MTMARRIFTCIAAVFFGGASLYGAAQGITGSGAYVSGVAIAADGSITIGGQFTGVGGLPRAGLAKLHSDGRLDASFNPALPASSRVDSLALQTDGKVIVGGYFPEPIQGAPGNAYSLLRLNTDGSLDTLPAQPDGSPSVLYVQSDGKILVGGGSIEEVANYSRLHIARLNADLTLDTVFNPSVPPSSTVDSFAEQSDGSILISGNFTTIADPVNEIVAYSLARVSASGNVDTSFSFPIDYRGGTQSVYQVRLLPSGKIIAGGYYALDGIGTTTVSMHNSDGSLDSTDFTPNTLGGPTVLSLQADGKALIGGVFNQIGNMTNSLSRNNIGRLNANGLPDSQFIAQTNSGASGQVIAIVEQTDGKIVVGGAFTTVDNQAHPYLARLLSNGAIDPGFTVSDEIFKGNFEL